MWSGADKGLVPGGDPGDSQSVAMLCVSPLGFDQKTGGPLARTVRRRFRCYNAVVAVSLLFIADTVTPNAANLEC